MKAIFRNIAASIVLVLMCGSLKAAGREVLSTVPTVNSAEFNLLLEQQRYLPVDTEVLLDDFFKHHRKDFRAMDLHQILDELEDMTPRQLDIVMDGWYLNPTLMTLLSVVAGEFGVDRMILGDVGLGILKLATGGGMGIWWLVDIFTTANRTKDRNFEEYCELADYAFHSRSSRR